MKALQLETEALRITNNSNSYDYIDSFKKNLEIYKPKLKETDYLTYNLEIKLIEQQYYNGIK